nr:RNA-directed DNA polymerase, eukaryota, reverse transcriptase zinc-binding domain protein [Tanacetum cinerariifolium]
MLKERMIVDKFLDKKIQPTVSEAMSWSKDMVSYFKDKWEEDRKKELKEGLNRKRFEDVCNDTYGTAKIMEDNECYTPTMAESRGVTGNESS